MAAPAKITPASLDVVSSATAADMLGAELDDLADRIGADAADNGTSRITAARVRALKRHSAQLRALHADTEQ
ncbi:MAG: hypothetical protein H0X35_11580 [Pseudonocardiales bacterium]|nr:hypothetical protein [Pseudonocardiales bacterium]